MTRSRALPAQQAPEEAAARPHDPALLAVLDEELREVLAEVSQGSVELSLRTLDLRTVGNVRRPRARPSCGT
jgi:hypothetical protein